MARVPRNDSGVRDAPGGDVERHGIVDADKLKAREQWLREEIRSTRGLMQRQAQWGITVLAAIALNLYYIRKDAHAYLVAQKQIAENELLPFSRWVIGTIFLCVLATLFLSIQRRFIKHHQAYRRELCDMRGGYSGIREPLEAGGVKWTTVVPFALMFTLPLLDLVLWFVFYVGEAVLNVRIAIPW